MSRIALVPSLSAKNLNKSKIISSLLQLFNKSVRRRGLCGGGRNQRLIKTRGKKQDGRGGLRRAGGGDRRSIRL